MATKKSTSKSRTAQTGLKKKIHVPLWAIIGGIVVVAGIGVAFVYNSYASATVATIFCETNNPTRCAAIRRAGYVNLRSAHVRSNASRCNFGFRQEFKFLGTSKGSAWYCLY